MSQNAFPLVVIFWILWPLAAFWRQILYSMICESKTLVFQILSLLLHCNFEIVTTATSRSIHSHFACTHTCTSFYSSLKKYLIPNFSMNKDKYVYLLNIAQWFIKYFTTVIWLVSFGGIFYDKKNNQWIIKILF